MSRRVCSVLEVVLGVSMFRSMSGFKAPYHYLTLLVVSEFNEWKVLLHGPAVTIQGIRQFSSESAKENAIAVARHYVHEYKHDELPILDEVPWVPMSHDEWLIWTA